MTDLSREEIVEQLRHKLAIGPAQAGDPAGLVTTGSPALDRLLPRGGLARGTLVEWLSPGPGSGAGTLALLAFAAACRDGGTGVVCDFSRQWNPLAASRCPALVVLRPRTLADQWWAAEQALRSPAVAAVWLPCARVAAREFRRWQLAAEAGNTLGLVLRPAQFRHEPGWADVRLLVTPRPNLVAGRRLHIELLRCRGGETGRSVELVLDEYTGRLRDVWDNHETLPVPVVPAVADPTPLRRRAGA